MNRRRLIFALFALPVAAKFGHLVPKSKPYFTAADIRAAIAKLHAANITPTHGQWQAIVRLANNKVRIQYGNVLT